MELTTTIIGISLFLLAVIPVLVAIQLKNKKTKGLKKVFDDLIIRHDVQLSEQENWNDNIIGLDKVNKKVLYISPKTPEGVSIDLQQVSGFKVIKTTENGQPAEKKELIGRLGLLFEYKDLEDCYLPFYDIASDDPLQLPYYNNKVSKWYNLIQACNKAKAMA